MLLMGKGLVVCVRCSNFYVALCCGMICEVYGFPKYWLKGYCPSYKPKRKSKSKRTKKTQAS